MRTTFLRGASLLFAGISVLSSSAAAQTNGFVLHCLSARAAGQGCVTRARDDVPTNLFHDPAAISWFRHPALEANISSFMPSLTFRNGANTATVDGAQHAYPLGSFAYVGHKASRFSWAVGLEPIGGFGSDFSLRNDLLGDGKDYESFFAALKAGPSLAIDVLPGVSVGASAYVSYAQIRDFRMPFTMPPDAAAGMAMIMGMDPNYPAMFAGVTELTAYGDSYDFAGWGRGASLGVAWRPGDAFRVSASWSPRSVVKLDGATATIDMGRQFEAMFGVLVQEKMIYHGMTETEAQAAVGQMLTLAGMDLSQGTLATYRAATEISEPQTAGIGFAFRVAPRWSLALEGVWMDWSRAEKVMPFILTEGDNPNVNILVNGDPTNTDFTYPFPLEWKDSWTSKAGLAFALSDATTLRAGYLHGSNPVPTNTVFIAFPAISSQAVTAGAGFQFLGVPFEASLVHALNTRIAGAPSGHLIGSEYQGSSTTMRQSVVTLGGIWVF
jgi:long-subunit fatty acid transport protein